MKISQSDYKIVRKTESPTHWVDGPANYEV